MKNSEDNLLEMQTLFSGKNKNVLNGKATLAKNALEMKALDKSKY